jgi:hypothetical protein
MALLIVTGLIASAASGRGLGPIIVEDDEYTPSTRTQSLTQNEVTWLWGPGGIGTSNEHTVNGIAGLFKSGAPQTSGDFVATLSAGHYPYHCRVHGSSMEGQVGVPPTISTNASFPDPFRVRWATADSDDGREFDVRYRIRLGNPPWEVWKTDTRKRSAVFGRDERPEAINPNECYELQARTQKAGKPSKRSGWSVDAAIGVCS